MQVQVDYTLRPMQSETERLPCVQRLDFCFLGNFASLNQMPTVTGSA
jgi:hypothetical protein